MMVAYRTCTCHQVLVPPTALGLFLDNSLNIGDGDRVKVIEAYTEAQVQVLFVVVLLPNLFRLFLQMADSTHRVSLFFIFNPEMT